MSGVVFVGDGPITSTTPLCKSTSLLCLIQSIKGSTNCESPGGGQTPFSWKSEPDSEARALNSEGAGESDTCLVAETSKDVPLGSLEIDDGVGGP